MFIRQITKSGTQNATATVDRDREMSYWETANTNTITKTL